MPAVTPSDAADEMRTFLYMILAVLIVLMVVVTKLVEKGWWLCKLQGFFIGGCGLDNS